MSSLFIFLNAQFYYAFKIQKLTIYDAQIQFGEVEILKE